MLFDLTADTPLPVLARGIADDDNDCHGGMRAMIPTVPPTSRTFTRCVRTSDQTPCTLSHQSPHQSPIHRRRHRGRNCGHCDANTAARRIRLGSDVAALSSTLVESSPFLIPKLTPGGRENLTPVVDILAGKNSPATLSVSRLDSDDTLSGLMSDSLSWRECTNLPIRLD